MLYMAASSLLIREKATSENHFVTPPIKLIMTLIIDIQVVLLGILLLLKNK